MSNQECQDTTTKKTVYHYPCQIPVRQCPIPCGRSAIRLNPLFSPARPAVFIGTGCHIPVRGSRPQHHRSSQRESRQSPPADIPAMLIKETTCPTSSLSNVPTSTLSNCSRLVFFYEYFQPRMADNKPGASRNETSAAGRSATDPLEAEPVPGEPVVTAPNQPEASSDPTGILSPDHWAQVRRRAPTLASSCLTTIPNRTQSQPMNFQSTRPLLVQLLRHSRLLFWSTGLSRAGDSTVRSEMLVTGMY